MTLVEVIDAARNILNEQVQISLTARSFPDNTSSFFRDADLVTFHNLIAREVQGELITVHEDYFLTQTALNVVNGCATYALPSNFLKMRRVEDVRTSDSVEITPITLNDKDRRYGNIFSSNSLFQNSYYIQGDTLILDRTPTYTQNSALKFHYIKRSTDITAGSDSSDIPQEYERVVIWGIVKLALFKQQTPNEVATAEYEKGLRKIREYAEGRQMQRSRYVKTRKVPII